MALVGGGTDGGKTGSDEACGAADAGGADDGSGAVGGGGVGFGGGIDGGPAESLTTVPSFSR